MATTDLKLEAPGILTPPGSVGRLVRVGFGFLCLYYVYGLVQASSVLISPEGKIIHLVWNGLLPLIFLISYVINIGFSRAWKKWPALLTTGIMVLVGIYAYVLTGSMESILLARLVWVLELYLFTHLGLAFLLAGALATPGCEMRALHDLVSRITKVPTKEHVCPVGPLSYIDTWEANRRKDV